MTLKFLLTGFEPFSNLEENPSQQIIEHISSHEARQDDFDLTTAVLPVDYVAADSCLLDLIHKHQPDAILSLGVATKREGVFLERVALNLDDSKHADNAGIQRSGAPVIPDGPAAYFSTLPLEALRDGLAQRGFPVEISNHAGAFLCNHAFYRAAYEIQKLGLHTVNGFIHVPLPTNHPDLSGNNHHWTLPAMVDCILVCLDLLRSFSTLPKFNS